MFIPRSGSSGEVYGSYPSNEPGKYANLTYISIYGLPVRHGTKCLEVLGPSIVHVMQIGATASTTGASCRGAMLANDVEVEWPAQCSMAQQWPTTVTTRVFPLQIVLSCPLIMPVPSIGRIPAGALLVQCPTTGLMFATAHTRVPSCLQISLGTFLWNFRVSSKTIETSRLC